MKKIILSLMLLLGILPVLQQGNMLYAQETFSSRAEDDYGYWGYQKHCCEEKNPWDNDPWGDKSNQPIFDEEHGCVWDIAPSYELAGQTYSFQKDVYDMEVRKLQAFDMPLSFNSTGDVYSFKGSGGVYRPYTDGTYRINANSQPYVFEPKGAQMWVTINSDYRITIDGEQYAAAKDCQNRGNKAGFGLQRWQVAHSLIAYDANNYKLTEFLETLRETEDMLTILFYECDQQNWQPGVTPGIIPKCFWEYSYTYLDDYYGSADLPFLAGIIDGGYAEKEGVDEMLKQITSGKIQETMADMAYAYTLAYLKCTDAKVRLNREDYAKMVNALAKEEGGRGIWSWVKKKYYGMSAENLSDRINTCEEARQLREDISAVVTELKDVVGSWDEIAALGSYLIDNLISYYDEITSTKNNYGRYQAGRLVIPVFTTFIPGAGQVGKVSKIAKVKDLLRAIKNVSKNTIDDILAELRRRARSVGIIKGAGKTIKFLDDPTKASQFAEEIIEINKATEGGGSLLNGTPSSAINTASYYTTVEEQGASIFKTIIKNHMFADGNKRTAVNMFKSFCNKSGITTTLTDAQMMDVANKVAINELDDVFQISQELIKQ